MKHYPYSVKKLLQTHFGKDYLDTMRRHDEWGGMVKKQSDILPLCWRDADYRALRHFQQERFYLDTVVEEDYIAYLYQHGEQRCVLLMFMLVEDEPVTIAPRYVQKLMKCWQKKGYAPSLLLQRVQKTLESDYVRFTHYIADSILLEVETIGRKGYFVRQEHRSWLHFYRKLIYLSQTDNLQEYECLFHRDIAVTRKDEDDDDPTMKSTEYLGLAATAELFRSQGPVQVCLKETEKGIYKRVLLAGDQELIIHVNSRNLITNLEFTQRAKVAYIPCPQVKGSGSLLARIPALQSMRPLNTRQTHSYGFLLHYSDGSVRKAYLTPFTTPEIPESTQAIGLEYTEEIVQSAVQDGNIIRFSNGSHFSAQNLYYASARQVQPLPPREQARKIGEKVLTPLYMLPLREEIQGSSNSYFWGEPHERFGPMQPVLSEKGQTPSDATVTAHSFRQHLVQSEATQLQGLMEKDGTWRAPPVYEHIRLSDHGIAVGSRHVGREQKQFLLTNDGRELPFDYEIDVDDAWDDLCPYNAATEEVHAPGSGYYWENTFFLKPGKWGIVDMDGNIVAEPQYVYAVGYYNGGGKLCVVARMIDGALRWGAIDTEGKEIIPCIYEDLYTRWGDALAFRRVGEELYGIMDMDGNILLEPQFSYFEEYEPTHQLLTVGLHEDALGVYSLKENRLLIAMEYDCVSYYNSIIACEVPYTCTNRYFDCTGKPVEYLDGYDTVFDTKDGLLEVWKDRKMGILKPDGTVLIPPVITSLHGDDGKMLYQRGYLLSRSKDGNLLGLRTADGQQILPQKYRNIIAYEDFVIAAEQLSGNFCVRDTLFAYDGTPILQGCYRDMYFDKDTRILTAATPHGKVYFQLQ